ncbi:MAG: hypothetical protein IRY87_05970 [Acetobacteraceae bacterium]|nr:hypothetical protein [Acetobacteraceae bacterium]
MSDEALVAAPDQDMVLRLLTEALMRKLGRAGATMAISRESKLLELGIIDSQGLLDIILEVEASCGRAFDPMHLDLESGVTLGMLAGAFVGEV